MGKSPLPLLPVDRFVCVKLITNFDMALVTLPVAPESLSIPEALAQLQQEITELALCQIAIARWQLHQQQTQQCQTSMQQLEAIQERINALAAELETQMRQFHLTASGLNPCYCALQSPPNPQRPANVWEIHHAAIPQVIRRGSQFILTAKSLDLSVIDEGTQGRERARYARRRREALEQWLLAQRHC